MVAMKTAEILNTAECYLDSSIYLQLAYAEILHEILQTAGLSQLPTDCEHSPNKHFLPAINSKAGRLWYAFKWSWLEMRVASSS